MFFRHMALRAGNNPVGGDFQFGDFGVCLACGPNGAAFVAFRQEIMEMRDNRRPELAVLALLSLVAWIGGCASSSRSRTEPVAVRHDSQESTLSAGLVFASPETSELAMATEDSGLSGWEFGRNDDRMGIPPSSTFGNPGYLRVRTRDYLYTSNGRPRDFSTSMTTTIQQGLRR
jgi:hypothetical protein